MAYQRILNLRDKLRTALRVPLTTADCAKAARVDYWATKTTLVRMAREGAVVSRKVRAHGRTVRLWALTVSELDLGQHWYANVLPRGRAHPGARLVSNATLVSLSVEC